MNYLIPSVTLTLPRNLPAVSLALFSVVGLSLTATAQVVYAATSNTQNGSWLLPSRWSFTPVSPASPTGPNNTTERTYNVSVSGGKTYTIGANITISSLNVTGNMTFNNSEAHTFSILNGLTASGGELNMQSAIAWTLGGTSTMASRFSFNNGSSIVNNGTLTMNPTSAAASEVEIAGTEVPASGYTLINNGHLSINRPNQQVTFQNFRMLNNGQWDVLQNDNISAESFVQNDPNASVRVYPGAVMTANQITFNGGTLYASGSRVVGSSWTFKNSTLVIGESLNQVANLTLDGNFSSGNVGNSTFRFLIAGGGTSQYDTLNIVNGMNFNTIALNFALKDNYQIKSTDTFKIITGNNLLNGTFANQSGSKLNVAGFGTFDIVRNQNFVQLQNFVASPVPEPEQIAMAAGVALLGFGLWRRRSATKA